MATKIIQFKDKDGNKEYPVTSSDAIGMSDGSGNLTEKLKKLENKEVPVEQELSTAPGSEKKVISQKVVSERIAQLENKAIPIRIIDGTEVGFYVIDEKGNIALKIVDGILDAAGLGSKLTKIIQALVGSGGGDENQGNGDNNTVNSDIIKAVEQNGFYLIDEQFNIGAMMTPNENTLGGGINYRII